MRPSPPNPPSPIPPHPWQEYRCNFHQWVTPKLKILREIPSCTFFSGNWKKIRLDCYRAVDHHGEWAATVNRKLRLLLWYDRLSTLAVQPFFGPLNWAVNRYSVPHGCMAFLHFLISRSSTSIFPPPDNCFSDFGKRHQQSIKLHLIPYPALLFINS